MTLALPRRDFLFRCLLLPAGLLAANRARAGVQETSETPPAPAPPPIAEPWPQDIDGLERWLRAPRQPVWESDDARTAALIAACRHDEDVLIEYRGGAGIEGSRRISPGLVFTVTGYTGAYVSGHCHLRHAERTFLIERIDHLHTADPAATATTP